MSSLEEKLRALQESKKSLERRVRNLGVKNRSLKKEYKVDRDVNKIDGFMVGYVREHLTKEHLSEFSSSDYLACPQTGQRMGTKACIARTFLEGHPRHKVCEKCTLLYDRTVELIKEIDKK